MLENHVTNLFLAELELHGVVASLILVNEPSTALLQKHLSSSNDFANFAELCSNS